MLKAVLAVCFILFSLVIYCNYKAYQAITAKEPAVVVTAIKYTGNTSAAINRLTAAIRGVWNISGETSSVFVIGSNKIIYPEIEAAYDYNVCNDSLQIKYNDGVESFCIRMHGQDTLEIAGETSHRYSRLKEDSF